MASFITLPLEDRCFPILPAMTLDVEDVEGWVAMRKWELPLSLIDTYIGRNMKYERYNSLECNMIYKYMNICIMIGIR